MKRFFVGVEYTTDLTYDNDEGWTGIDLYLGGEGDRKLAARVVYWDAIGFVISITVDELPLEIVEGMIAEARARIKTR